MKKYIILILLPLMACAHVREEDLNAWRGIPLEELELHPFFSSLPLEKRLLSGGTELWIYSNTVGVAQLDCNFGVCQTIGQTKGCLNQFVIKGTVVVEYRPVPLNIRSCFTDCRVRPSSRPCSKD